jgi:tripartite-type tricarboxylate transporter receptor subunit TctC
MLRISLTHILLSGAIGLSGAAWCEPYPSRPVRAIVAASAAGGPNAVARILGQQLATQTGQSFVIDNRPGANGILGAEMAAKAAPDGYTLLLTTAAFTINPNIYRKLPFDPLRDFMPVTNIGSAEAMILTVNPSLPARSVQELIALAARPDSRLAYGSPGVGNILHLAGALFNARAGTNLMHVPYKGAGAAITGLIGGEVQVMFVTTSLGLAQIRAGKLRALAYNSPTRAAFLSEVPTMGEAGVSAMEMDASWYGVFAPAHTPRGIVALLFGQIRKALDHPQLREHLAALGVEPIGSTPAQFAAFVAASVARFGELVRLAGVEPE